MRHGGNVLIDSLRALGATTAFGVPGESYLAALDAMHDSDLRFILCRQEGGAAFMAAAWGKLTGTPGICFVTRGPGATNASIGVHTAMQDSVPMILFVGQVATHMKGREAFQEVDYRAMFGTVAKWVAEVDEPHRLPEIVARAWSMALSGRPGPVVVALPEDMLSAASDTPALTRAAAVSRPMPDPQAMAEAQTLLAKAARPLILIGGANWDADAQTALQSFAEVSHIPVLAAFRYQDMFDNHSPVFAGEAGVGMPPHAKRLMTQADAILALNVRFGENVTGGYTLLDVPVPKQALIHVHASDLEIGKVYQPTVGIHACHNAVAKALMALEGSDAGWAQTARAEYEASLDAPDQPSPVDMGHVIRHLRDVLPDDAILANGAGNFAIWPNKFFPFGPRHRLLAPQSGAMGYGLPAAIAAKIAEPDRCVICVAGDGDFQMTGQELATAVQAGVAPVVLVVNNGTYGTIRAHQERHYPGRVSGTDMVSPNFADLAQAYGMLGERVETTDDFQDAFARALASETGAVLDLNVAAEALGPRVTISGLRSSTE